MNNTCFNVPCYGESINDFSQPVLLVTGAYWGNTGEPATSLSGYWKDALPHILRNVNHTLHDKVIDGEYLSRYSKAIKPAYCNG